jgi:hypothetical protein
VTNISRLSSRPSGRALRSGAAASAPLRDNRVDIKLEMEMASVAQQMRGHVPGWRDLRVALAQIVHDADHCAMRDALHAVLARLEHGYDPGTRCGRPRKLTRYGS